MSSRGCACASLAFMGHVVCLSARSYLRECGSVSQIHRGIAEGGGHGFDTSSSLVVSGDHGAFGELSGQKRKLKLNLLLLYIHITKIWKKRHHTILRHNAIWRKIAKKRGKKKRSCLDFHHAWHKGMGGCVCVGCRASPLSHYLSQWYCCLLGQSLLWHCPTCKGSIFMVRAWVCLYGGWFRGDMCASTDGLWL